MWKEVMNSVNYQDWSGEEMDLDPNQAEKAEKEASEPMFDERKVDGITIDNLKENSTEEAILSKVCNKEQLEKLSIHPMGSTKSKLIKCTDQKLILSIGHKLDKKIHEGKMIYSRPHVPFTPPKPSNANLEDNHPGGTINDASSNSSNPNDKPTTPI